jgi:hypothetical protein
MFRRWDFIKYSRKEGKVFLVFLSKNATYLCPPPTRSYWVIPEGLITIYAPLIYTALCIMFWMRAYPLRGEVGGGWALEFESFLGPMKWHRAERRVPFGAQKTR